MSLRLVVIGLLLTTAVAFGLIAYQITHRPNGPRLVAQAPVTEPLTISYLVAARAVPPGTLVRPEDFTQKTIPSAAVPPGAVVDTPEARAQLRGALIRRYVEPGMPLLQADMLRPRERGFLAAVLAPGMRAVSIGVDPVSGVAGLIWPGDRVDVILTQEFGQPGGRAARLVTSEAVLTNMQVIAVDQDIAQGTPVAGTSAGHLAGTITIQATADQAEKVAVAMQLGHLSFAVRSGDDLPPGGDVRTSMTGTDVSPELARASAAAAGTRVQVIEGGARAEVTFR
ncbi:MAG TPA: Flp pilus assembly protein CpaB [Acetobacteraceae bacterium]|jgi:pilus assembly protein CpaB|nr:Flp pilus assembly protein CpaB [Acetobacteraceae bacterium]